MFEEILAITDQVNRYSPEHAVVWQQSVQNWTDARKTAFCAAIRKISRSAIMSGRVAKIIGAYNDGPVTNQPILVFGEVPPGGGMFLPGTNQLIFLLDGTAYWRYPFTRGLCRKIEIRETPY
jgi:hypothetical protein